MNQKKKMISVSNIDTKSNLAQIIAQKFKKDKNQLEDTNGEIELPNKVSDLDESLQLKQKEINKDIIHLNVTANNSAHLTLKLQGITLKLKNNTQKVYLTLETLFENKPSFVKFETEFAKIAHKITYFDWKIKSYFADYVQGQTLGQIISRLTNAYRITINIDIPFLLDKSALYLAQGFSKLKKLHVLHLAFGKDNKQVNNILSKKGGEQILESLSHLPNLELINCDLYKNCNEQKGFNKLAHIQRSIYEYYDNEKYVLNQFINSLNKDIDQRRYTLSTLTFYPNHYNNLINDETSTYSVQEIKKFIEILKLSFELPYLTEFFMGRDINHENYERSFLDDFMIFLEEFTKYKLLMITQIVIFQEQIQSYISFNPKLVIADLWIH